MYFSQSCLKDALWFDILIKLRNKKNIFILINLHARIKITNKKNLKSRRAIIELIKTTQIELIF